MRAACFASQRLTGADLCTGWRSKIRNTFPGIRRSRRRRITQERLNRLAKNPLSGGVFFTARGIHSRQNPTKKTKRKTFVTQKKHKKKNNPRGRVFSMKTRRKS